MLIRKLLLAILIFTAFQSAFAQTTETKKKDDMEALRREALELLRETNGEVGSLRSLENRIGFASEMASLMWFYDEKQASVMYQTVISDFKQLLGETDARLNAMNLTPNESEYRAGLFGMGDESGKAQLTRKFYKAMGVRQQIAMSLAEHDATLAYDFYYDTLSLITNPELRKSFEQRDGYFENQLLQRIAEKDPAKAYEMGRKSLAKGVNYTHPELLNKIYEKDAEKGAAFAADIVGKLKSDSDGALDYYIIASLLRMGGENAEKIKKEKGKKPMFTNANLRDLAEVLADNLLKIGDRDGFDINSYTMLVEKYAPARAVQIRAKFAGKFKPKTPAAAQTDGPEVLRAPPLGKSDGSVEVAARIDEEVRAQKEQAEMMENVKKLGSKELSKEEREKIVAQSRKIIGGLGSRMEKLMALSALAGQVARLGDRELASEIMKDAQPLVNPAPKNMRDYMEVWMLASAYAEADPQKAFPLLEDAIFRLNETLAAFIKVGEFIDVSGEMFDDGEVQLTSAFGGSMINGLTRELGIASPTVRNLAIADFAKIKALTNRFDRTEVRILAKMLVLRAVLGDETKKSKVEEPDTMIEEN